jgi:flagellar operon protein (TIGR03826 family)
MSQLLNCPTCGSLFIQNSFISVCNDCYKEEIAHYERIGELIRNRDNRLLTLEEITEATGVPIPLFYKFVRKGWLQLSYLPNVYYQCEVCHQETREGRICNSCRYDFRKDLEIYEREQTLKKE